MDSSVALPRAPADTDALADVPADAPSLEDALARARQRAHRAEPAAALAGLAEALEDAAALRAAPLRTRFDAYARAALLSMSTEPAQVGTWAHRAGREIAAVLAAPGEAARALAIDWALLRCRLGPVGEATQHLHDLGEACRLFIAHAGRGWTPVQRFALLHEIVAFLGRCGLGWQALPAAEAGLALAAQTGRAACERRAEVLLAALTADLLQQAQPQPGARLAVADPFEAQRRTMLRHVDGGRIRQRLHTLLQALPGPATESLRQRLLLLRARLEWLQDGDGDRLAAALDALAADPRHQACGLRRQALALHRAQARLACGALDAPPLRTPADSGQDAPADAAPWLLLQAEWHHRRGEHLLARQAYARHAVAAVHGTRLATRVAHSDLVGIARLLVAARPSAGAAADARWRGDAQVAARAIAEAGHASPAPSLAARLAERQGITLRRLQQAFKGLGLRPPARELGGAG